MKGRIKSLKRSIKEREHSPFTYEFKDEEVHRCLNCNHEFTGNYCPYCSQSADTKRITWQSVPKGFLELWGFSTRSVPSTIWQLIYRPGYLILDYLRGRRVSSYPPIKLLVVVALITGLLHLYVIPENGEKVKIEVEADKIAPGEESSPWEQDFIDKTERISNWCDRNEGWAMLAICSLLILPTWLLYRHSRRIPKHTVPEGFYIQVLMCPLMLIISVLSDIDDIFILLIPIYYYYSYRQLFGYGIWGTVWRLFLCFVIATIGFLLLIFASYIAYRLITKISTGI